MRDRIVCRLLVCLCALTLVCLGGSGRAAVAAPSANGTLTVEVYRDVAGAGTLDAAHAVRQAGIPVAVIDMHGNVVEQITDAEGRVTVPPGALTGGRYRIDASIPAALATYLQFAPAASNAEASSYSSRTTFVDTTAGNDVTVRLAVWNPADYAQKDPPLAVSIQRSAVPSANANEVRSVVSVPWSARGALQDTPTMVQRQADTGTTYGVAYERHSKRVFSAAFAKRFTAYGPGGPGAVYVSDAAGAGPATRFVTIPGAGDTAHSADDRDAGFFDVPGKEGLGGIALSEDGSTLYVINLADRRLYAYSTAGATAGDPIAITALSAPADCAAADDWRPSAVTSRDGKLFIAGVCSAESSGLRSDLKLVVQTLNGTTLTPVLAQPLDYLRGDTTTNVGGDRDIATHWNAWLSEWDVSKYAGSGSGVELSRPEPWVASLVFETDGSMVVGFRDRFADQASHMALSPDVGDGTLYRVTPGGDLNKACANPDGTWSWEGTGGCPNNGDASNNGTEAGDPVEYFPGDFYPGAGWFHQETSYGSVALAPRENELVSTAVEPVRGKLYRQGLGFYDRTSGAGPGNSPVDDPAHAGAILVDNDSYSGGDGPSTGFGKGNGLGAIAVIADLAPVQIGNRTWYDGDHDGLQDPDEPPLPKVTVTLYDDHDAVIATAVTDNNGEYYFGSNDGPTTASMVSALPLRPDTSYRVHFDATSADVSGLTSVFGITDADELTLTAQQAGGDLDATLLDSNPDSAGDATVTTGGAGSTDHSIDAGWIAQKHLGVAKTVIGESVNPEWEYVVAIECLDFRGAPIAQQSISLRGGSTRAVTLPAGTVCGVVETQTHEAASVAYLDENGQPLATAPKVRVVGTLQHPTIVQIVNTFTTPPPGATTPPAGATTPPSAVRPPTETIPTPAAPGPRLPTQPLPRTGGSAMSTAVAAGALSILGAALLLLTRKSNSRRAVMRRLLGGHRQ